MFTVRLWWGRGMLATPNSDLVAQGAGLRALESRALAEDGVWPPPWDPSCDAGSPAHANPLTSYLSPLHWPFLILPLDLAANWVLILNTLLAGLAMYAFTRRRFERPETALFCGVAYMVSYRYLALLDAGWLPTVTMYALVPLIALTTERLLDEPSGSATAAFAVVLALSAMQGSAQSFYYALLALLVFVAVRAPSLPAPRRGKAAAAVLGGGALALLIAAPDLLPRAQFAALSTRTNYDYRFFLGTTPGWSALKTLFDPFDAGGARTEYWEHNFYFGLFLYPLAAWGWLKDRRRSVPWLAACAAIVLLCFDTPVLRFLFRFCPGFALFRMSTRALQLAQFGLIVAAGLGVDRLLRHEWRRRAGLAAALLCLCPLVDSGVRMIPRLKVLPLSEAFPEPAFLDLLRRAPGNGRLAAIGRTVVPYGLASYHGIDMINGYEPLNLRHYQEYFAVLQTGDPANAPSAPVVWTDLSTIARPDLLRALDARYLAANRPLPFESVGYAPFGGPREQTVFQFYRGYATVPVHLWRDRRPLGPAYFASSIAPVAGERESLSSLAASTSPLDARVFGWSGGVLTLAPGTARETRRGSSRYEYEVDGRGRGFLILSQVWYPGWRATVDGAETAVYRVNHALIGVSVPPGPHRLTLEMTSPALRTGVWLCLLGLAGCAFLAGPFSSGARGRRKLS